MVDPTEQTIYSWWNQHLVGTSQRVGTPSIENSDLVSARNQLVEFQKDLAANPPHVQTSC